MTEDYILDEPFKKIRQGQCLLLDESSLPDEFIQPNLGALLEAVVDLEKKLNRGRGSGVWGTSRLFLPVKIGVAPSRFLWEEVVGWVPLPA